MTLHEEVAEKIARELLDHLSIIEPETEAKDHWLYQVRLGDLRMIGMPMGKAFPAIAAILSDEYGDVEALREAVHGWLDMKVGLILWLSTTVCLGDFTLLRFARLVNRCHDNGDGTVTITERTPATTGSVTERKQ